MKKCVIILGLLTTFSSLFGQSEEKKGFIGLNIGTSYILNRSAYKMGVGANLNLVNFGYEFKKSFGIAVKWMGGAHILSKDNELGYGAVLVGPMYTLKISDKVLVDFKFQPGFFWVTEKFKLQSVDPNGPTITIGTLSIASPLAFSTGATFRHNFARRWSWMTIVDYNTGMAPGILISKDRLHALSLNLGIGFRI